MAQTPRTISRITDEAQLRAVIGGGPTELVAAKIADRLNEVTRRFIDASPFVCVATSGAGGDGLLDVSPRGDPAGFVRVLDDRTLLLPERPGNRLADTLTNLLADARIALLFLLPGVGDTFRVNGTAIITDDAELLADCAVAGKVPRLGIMVTIEEAFTHCPKALIRSGMWDPARFIDKATLPTGGEVNRSLQGPGFDAEEYDRERAARYARGEGLY